ncbi:MAG: hypothetical protein ABIQ11_00605 [Saprospiraceae bacterium]
MSSLYPSHTTYFSLGKTIKSHSTGGQLRLMIEDQFKSYLRKGSFIFLDMNGSKVPFQIASVEEGAHFVISFEGVKDKKKSDALSGHEIFIPLENVKSRHQRSPRNIKAKWDEFKITDEQSGETFDIIRVEEFPQQLMAIVELNEKEILIPLSDQLIISIDKENKILRMEFPEGILDL